MNSVTLTQNQFDWLVSLACRSRDVCRGIGLAVGPSRLGHPKPLPPQRGCPMSLIVQSWLQVGTLAGVIVGGLIWQTHHIGKQIEGLKNHIEASFKDLEDRLDKIGV